MFWFIYLLPIFPIQQNIFESLVLSSIKSSYNTIRSLGFYPYSNLSPKLHIQDICWRHFQILDFFHWISIEFKLDRLLKIIYCSLVYLILENKSILYDSQLSTDSLVIKRVQFKCLLFTAYYLKILYLPHNYSLDFKFFKL